MAAYEKNSRIVGLLLLIAIVTGILSVILSSSLLHDPDYLLKISAHGDRIMLAAFLIVLMAFACAGIAIGLYPVLEEDNL